MTTAKPRKRRRSEGTAPNRTEATTTLSDKKNVDTDEDDEDQDILEAARAWAASAPSADDQEEGRPDRGVYSLHLTQLSYDATDYDIRSLFTKKGCLISSVRLVYDSSAGQRTFRGVAFVDVADRESYAKALHLNRQVFMGRKINVRPTRTKKELADIVARTKETLPAKIEATKKVQQDSAKNSKKRKTSRQTQAASGKVDSKASKDGKGKPVKKQRTTKAGKNDKSRKPNTKLTKKERNRRAAIIMAKRRGKK